MWRKGSSIASRSAAQEFNHSAPCSSYSPPPSPTLPLRATLRGMSFAKPSSYSPASSPVIPFKFSETGRHSPLALSSGPRSLRSLSISTDFITQPQQPQPQQPQQQQQQQTPQPKNSLDQVAMQATAPTPVLRQTTPSPERQSLHTQPSREQLSEKQEESTGVETHDGSHETEAAEAVEAVEAVETTEATEAVEKGVGEDAGGDVEGEDKGIHNGNEREPSPVAEPTSPDAKATVEEGFETVSL